MQERTIGNVSKEGFCFFMLTELLSKDTTIVSESQGVIENKSGLFNSRSLSSTLFFAISK